MTQAEFDLIKPHLNRENAAQATVDNGIELLCNQMVELSRLALSMHDEMDRTITEDERKARRLKLSMLTAANHGR